MKIESASTAALDPVRVENTGAGNMANSQVSTQRASRSSTVESPARKNLQKETRSTEEIKKDLAAINEQLKTADSSLQFAVDDKSDELVVRIVDRDSGKVIRQIPPESIVRLRESLKELSGLFVKEKV
jgi:flagellar protein FlaG